MKNIAVILVLVAVASGCIHSSTPGVETDSEESQQEPEKVFAECSDVRIRIDSASSDSAMIRQMNEESIGEVTAEWSYRTGEAVSRKVNLSTRGDLKLLSSGANGDLEQFSVSSSRCPEQVETFTP